MAVWVAAAALLRRRGNARIIYRLLKLVMWGYTMPLVYLAFFGWNRLVASEGWVLITTPGMDMVLRVCFLLWLAGVAVYAAAQIPLIRRFRAVRGSRVYARVDMTAILDRLKDELKIRKNIVLYQGYRVASPFICGFRRTEIYLPAGRMGERELEIVLRHELMHYKQRDTFWKPAFAVVNGLFWFNPLVWYVSRKMQRWAEAGCDEACCREGLTAREYFGTILEMVTSEAWRPGACSPLWAEGENELMWRIRCIQRGHCGKSSRSWAAVAAAAVIMVGSCLSVYAATVGAGGLYDELFRDTRDQVKEPVLPEEIMEHTGDAEKLFEGLVVEEPPEIWPQSIDGAIKSGAVAKMPCFSRQSGDIIEIAGVAEPKNTTIQVGIIEPDNYLRYIDVKGSFSHTFQLTKEGLYRVYIQNLNSETVSVGGAYS